MFLQRIDTSSVVRAVQSVGDMNLTEGECIEAIRELCDDAPQHLDFVNEREAALHLKYVVSQAMTNGIGGWQSVAENASKWAHKHPMSVTTYKAAPYYQAKTGEGTDRKKKGEKKVEALKLWRKHEGEKFGGRKEWIAILVSEVGCTTAGASTYHHNMKKGIWK